MVSRVGKKSIPALPQTIKNMLRGARDPYAQLSEIRKVAPPQLYFPLAAWLPNIAQRAIKFIEGRFPHDLRSLRGENRILEPLPAEREITWAAAYLLSFAEKLNAFLQQRLAFEVSLMNGDFATSKSILDAIQDALGQSLWLLETRIAFLQLSSGLEAQKLFANSIKEMNLRTAIPFMVSFVSERNEPTTNPTKFRETFIDNSAQWNISRDFRRYLRYRIADHFTCDAGTISSVLRCDFISSTIDLYETFVRLAIRTISEEGEFRSVFASAISELANVICDPRLNKILFFDSNDTSWLSRIPHTNTAILDAFCVGDTALGASRAEAFRHSEVVDTSAVVTGATIFSDLGDRRIVDGSLHNKFLALGARVVLKDVENDLALIELQRIATNCRFSSFAADIEAFIEHELSPDPLPNTSAAARGFLSSSYLDVRALRFLPGSGKTAYASLFRSQSGPAVSLELYRAEATEVSDNIAGISTSLHTEICTERAYRHQKWSDVVGLAHQLRQFGSLRLARIATRFESQALLRQMSIGDAVELVVREALHDPGCFPMLPVETCINYLTKEQLGLLAARLSIPIILDFYVRNVSPDKGNLRAYAYEDFLASHSINKPSELFQLKDRFPKDQIVYFLRYVCVQETMHDSIVFESSNEIEEERLAICKLLLELDETNETDYKEEIRSLTKKRLIHGGVRQIEQSKISIDGEPLRRWAERHLKEPFARFQSLQQPSITEVRLEEEAAPSSIVNDAGAAQQLPKVPLDEAANLLISTVSNFLKECFVNAYHGLDCYLSMRIRHGALAGKLRAPVEEEQLITQREANSTEYKSNSYWMEIIAPIDWDIAYRIDESLKQFSREYDRLLETFTQERVQIKSDDKQRGLFDTTVPTSGLLLLAQQMGLDCTFEHFIDLCLVLFWDVVDKSLLAVRQHIDESLKADLNKLFVGLINGIERTTATLPIPELNNAVRNAQTKAQQALEDIKDWFRQPKPSLNREFTFQDLVDIGLQQVKTLHRDFEPEVRYFIDEMPPFYELTRFSDIFFIIFDNIHRHSRVQKSPWVEVRATLHDRQLSIEVRNEISVGPTPDDQRRLEVIRDIIQRGEQQRAVRSEGGTGLLKLQKIIHAERARNTVQFDFDDGPAFHVRLYIQIAEFEHDVPGAEQ